jgi:acetyltransferase-like isoleucine patch superfamily enzyme
MQIRLTKELKEELFQRGVDTLWAPDSIILPLDCRFEPPCSLKWMAILYSCALGAFSYAVNGYFFACTIGRYVSIGENVQAGRGDHPTDWLSTSPFQYLHKSKLFDVGTDFSGGKNYAALGEVSSVITRPPTVIKPIEIGHDVWIGHGAYVKPGVKIGNGAVVAAHAVVTKDVPPYAIVAGNPARVKRMRFDDQVIESLENLQWWQYALWDLQDIAFDQIELAIEQIGSRIEEGGIKPYTPGFVDLSALHQASFEKS